MNIPGGVERLKSAATHGIWLIEASTEVSTQNTHEKPCSNAVVVHFNSSSALVVFSSLLAGPDYRLSACVETGIRCTKVYARHIFSVLLEIF